MKKKLNQNKGLLLTLSVLLGIGAIVARKFLAGEPASLRKASKKKKHSCLKIPVSLLQSYHDAGGSRIILEFMENGKYIGLKFYGFTSDNSICIQQALDVEKLNCLESGNIYAGRITHDDQGRLLHDLLASDPKNFREWTLEPVKYNNTDDRYVSYAISDEGASLIRSRLNPSPPA